MTNMSYSVLLWPVYGSSGSQGLDEQLEVEDVEMRDASDTD